MYQIPPLFSDFIAPDCDRLSFIQKFLNSVGLDTAVLQMQGKNHIYVKFPQSQYNPQFRIKTVIAHYDRIGIGANDNSAAVFSLMQWAGQLNQIFSKGGFHNVRLIFTDGEELGQEGVSSQGAFPLAQLFRKLGIINDDIYVFDCMGRGDVPVLTETRLPKGVSKKFAEAFTALEVRAQNLIQTASGGKWFCLSCNYSDNASFIANGIPAVAITILPSEDVSIALKGGQPESWKKFHTPADNLESLTPQAFELTASILRGLAMQKTLV